MPKSDSQLMRDHINLLMEGEQIAEQRPMGLLRSLNLQVQKAFGAGGADTQLWSGNYANSIYADWRRQKEPGDTGRDFIGWYSKSQATSDVQRVEDSFIYRIVFKVTQGKLDDVISDQQVSQIARELAKVTARQHLGLTHRLTSASTPEQREQAMQILQQFIPYVHNRIVQNRLNLKTIASYLVRVAQLPPVAVNRAFRSYAAMIQQGKLQLGGITAADFKFNNTKPITDPHKINALIPILDDFVLACVIHAASANSTTGSVGAPSTAGRAATRSSRPSAQSQAQSQAQPATGLPQGVTLNPYLTSQLKKTLPTDGSGATLPPNLVTLLVQALSKVSP